MNTYFKILDEICEELKINYKVISDGYIIVLELKNQIKYINGTLIGLNTEISGLLCKDKYAMYEVLKQYNIPVISHKLIWHEGNNIEEINSKLKEIKNYFYNNNCHIVIKDNLGSRGQYVYQIKDEKEIKTIFKTLLNHTRSIVLNPFYNIKKEYRLIFLNGKCRLLFYKELKNGEWQHNLAKGSIASKNIDELLKNKLIEIGEKVNKALQTKFISIDIIEDINNNLLVLEVNSHVSLNKYLEQHIEDYKTVKQIYKDAILELFTN